MLVTLCSNTCNQKVYKIGPTQRPPWFKEFFLHYHVHYFKHTNVGEAFVMPSYYSPLRRLSLALKIIRPYQPHGAPNTENLARFLSETKNKYLQDVHATPGRGGEWTVVMGNEAGGTHRLTCHEHLATQ